MDTKYKIGIPKPCHEDWNKMTRSESGKFCGSCAKNVIDFTQMDDVQIQSYFEINQSKNVCGRFKYEQLDEIIIKIPSQVLFSQVHFHKIFLLALLITMGTTLFSCADKEGNKQKIDGVEVVQDGSKVASRTAGELVIYNDSLNPPPAPKLKMDQVKFVKPDSKTEKVEQIEISEITMGMPTLVSDTISEK